jgi:hypothetical protein
MFTGTVSVDYNGIVLFDPDRLRARYGGAISEGTNLFERYTTTDEGDEVIAAGLIVPILGIDDAGYEVIIRLADEPNPGAGPTVFENGIYPLVIGKRLVVADVAVLAEWIDEIAWQDVPVPPGTYAVTVRGFQERDATGTSIDRAGYEFVLAPVAQLPPMSATMEMDMQVLRFNRPGDARTPGAT